MSTDSQRAADSAEIGPDLRERRLIAENEPRQVICKQALGWGSWRCRQPANGQSIHFIGVQAAGQPVDRRVGRVGCPRV